MKNWKLHIFQAVIVTIVLTLINANEVVRASGTEDEVPNAEPPYGLNVEGQAGGEKWYGVICVDYDNLVYIQQTPPEIVADATIYLRLRHGGEIITLIGEATGVTITDPKAKQEAIHSAMEGQVLLATHPSETDLQAVLKSVSELGVYEETEIVGFPPQELLVDLVEIVDIQVAINDKIIIIPE